MGFTSKFFSGICVCTLLSAALIGAPPGGLRIVKTIDLHSYSEDITYIRTGPYAKHVALIEGSKVRAYPFTSKGNGSITELFDLAGRIPRDFMNGLAYMDSEKRFAIVSRQFMDKIMVFEPNGKLQSERPITYPDGYVVNWVEGIEYIPADAPYYPDHLAMCAGQDDGADFVTGDIMIMTRNGKVAKRILLPADSWGCGGITYRAPGQLLVTGYNSGDWGVVTVIDFDGKVLAGESDRIDPAGEGLVSLPDGNILAVGNGTDVMMLGPDLKRRPEGDRVFRLAQGVGNVTYGLTWNSGKDSFVLCSNSLYNSLYYSLFDLPLSFSGVVKLTGLTVRPEPPSYNRGRLTYLPGEDLIGVAQSAHMSGGVHVPLSIQFFRGVNGSYDSGIPLPMELWNRGIIRGVAHIGATNEFAVTFNGTASVNESGLVHILTRSGEIVRTIQYPAITRSIAAVAAFPSSPQLLMTDGSTLYVGDLIGNVTAQYSLLDLGMIGIRGSVMDLAFVSSGPYAGMFAAVDFNREPSKLTIFTFDQPGKKK